MLCARSGNAAESPSAHLQFYDDAFECYAGPLALHLPDTYAQLLQLGKVDGTRDVRRQTERGLTTTERQIDFPGLSLRVYLYSGDPGRYQAAVVRIHGPAWQLSRLRVGDAVGALALSPGWPRLPRWGSWEVQGDSAHVLVHIRAGRIFAVDYFCGSGA